MESMTYAEALRHQLVQRDREIEQLRRDLRHQLAQRDRELGQLRRDLALVIHERNEYIGTLGNFRAAIARLLVL